MTEADLIRKLYEYYQGVDNYHKLEYLDSPVYDAGEVAEILYNVLKIIERKEE